MVPLGRGNADSMAPPLILFRCRGIDVPSAPIHRRRQGYTILLYCSVCGQRTGRGRHPPPTAVHHDHHHQKIYAPTPHRNPPRQTTQLFHHLTLAYRRLPVPTRRVRYPPDELPRIHRI